MKKIVLRFVFVVLVAGTYACSPSNSSQIQGKWSCVSAVMDITKDDGTSRSVDFMKTTQCEKPNSSTYTFDGATNSITIEEMFSCQENKYKGTYKWLNEEKDIELTVKESNSVTKLHVVSISSDSLHLTTGEDNNQVHLKMVKLK